MRLSNKTMSIISKIAVLGALIATMIHSPQTITETPQKAVLEQQEQNITLLPELIPICACESTGKRDGIPKHFDKNGNVLQGKINKLDRGACQINLGYHQEAAKKMGIDVETEQGNIIYANYLYTTQGSQPWSASSACWGNGLDDVGTSSIMSE